VIYSFHCSNGTFQLALTTSTGKSQLHCANVDGVTVFPPPVLTPVVMTEQQATTPTQNFIDGNLLGWGVVAAMVLAWSIHVLRRAI
jgi:hypothetical protein